MVLELGWVQKKELMELFSYLEQDIEKLSTLLYSINRPEIAKITGILCRNVSMKPATNLQHYYALVFH